MVIRFIIIYIFLSLKCFVFAQTETPSYAQSDIEQSKNITQVNSMNHSAPNTAAIKAKLQAWSVSSRWRRLLYYDAKGKSEITSPDFFLNPEGNVDPYKELLTTYEQMFFQEASDIHDDHAICKFPARFYVLDKELKTNEFHKIKHCPKFLSFINRAAGQSISVVFSAYNLNSPSSAFGHTFLKINKQGQEGMDLLNYGINYAASTEGTNPFFYAINGLFGFFRGDFTAVPFYYKIREYNDFESRDIWEYELGLDYEDVQLLTMHFWELGRGWAWYYFLGKNCSYWALKSIGAVSPKYNFDKDLNQMLVIPVETIKSLYQYEGLVKSVKFRPSINKQLVQSLGPLDRNEKLRVKQIASDLFNERLQDKETLKEDSVQILETSMLYYDYQYATSYITDENKTLEKKQPLLLARSYKQKTPALVVEKPSAPETIHPPQRVGASYRQGENFKSLNLGYKMGFHELYDAKDGMDVPIAMNYFDLNLQMYQLKDSSDWRVSLDRLDILRIEALSPTSTMDKKLSWRLRLGVGKNLYTYSLNEIVGVASFDTGLTFSFTQDRSILLYLMFSNALESSARFNHKIRLSSAPLLGLKVHWTSNLATQLEVRHRWYWDLEQLWQRQWQVEGTTQYYMPKLKLAAYAQGLFLYGHTEDLRLEDAHWEMGLRKFY